MASNSDYIITIYDVNNEPLAGIVPTWKNFFEVTTGAVPPVVACVEIGGGLYRIPRATVPEAHYVGILDFGAGSYPRYGTYDSRAEDALEVATQQDIAELNLAATPPYVQFTGGGETVCPVIQSVSAPTRNQINITYSEPVIMTSDLNGALRLANYVVDSLTLLSVQRVADDQVCITTLAQTPQMRYTLTVFNVEDLDGNPITQQQ